MVCENEQGSFHVSVATLRTCYSMNLLYEHSDDSKYSSLFLQESLMISLGALHDRKGSILVIDSRPFIVKNYINYISLALA